MVKTHIDVNVWYAGSDKEGLIGPGKLDILRAKNQDGNIGHVNIVLTMYGSRPELREIRMTYPELVYEQLAPRESYERLSQEKMKEIEERTEEKPKQDIKELVAELSKQLKLKMEQQNIGEKKLKEIEDAQGQLEKLEKSQMTVNEYKNIAQKLEGLQVTHSFWPKGDFTQIAKTASFFRVGGKMDALFKTMDDDRKSESFGEPTRVQHGGEVRKEYEVKWKEAKGLHELVESTDNLMKSLASNLYQTLKKNETYFNKLSMSAQLADDVKNGKYSLIYNYFPKLEKELQDIQKDIPQEQIKGAMVEQLDIEDRLLTLLHEDRTLSFSDSKFRESLMDSIQYLQSSMRDHEDIQKFLNALDIYIENIRSEEQQPQIANYLERVKQAWCDADIGINYTRDALKIISDLNNIQLSLEQHRAKEGAANIEVANLDRILRERYQSIGRDSDSGFELVVNEQLPHHLDVNLLLQAMQDAKKDKYDVYGHNCGVSARNCIIKAIPENTRAKLESIAPSSFFSLKPLTPLTPEDFRVWASKLNKYMGILNEKELGKEQSNVLDTQNDSQVLQTNSAQNELQVLPDNGPSIFDEEQETISTTEEQQTTERKPTFRP